MRPRLFLVLPGLVLLASPGWAGAVFVVDTTLVDLADINAGDGKCEWATFPPVGQRCTLRAAVEEANALPGLDYILIPNGWTITLSRAGANEDQSLQGDLDILDDLHIQTVHVGFANAPAVIDAAGIDRVFDVHSPAELRGFNLVVTGGLNGIGAGVNVRSPAAEANLFDCLLTGNEGVVGVALYAGGGASSLTACTVEGNRNLTASTASAVRRGAGGSLEVHRSTIAANPGVHHNVSSASFTTIKNSTIVNGYRVGVNSTADLWLQNVTIFGNQLYGLQHSQPGAFGSPTIINSVIAYNGSSSLPGLDCWISTPGGSVNTAFPNLDTDNSCGFLPAYGGIPSTDPLLGPLGPNGGRVQTMAPQFGTSQSPVIDTGNNSYCDSPDQRGASRPLDGDIYIGGPNADCDLGAVESLPCDTEPPGILIFGPWGDGTTVACLYIETGSPYMEIQAGATHEFRARQHVELRNGFRVLDGATFSVVLDHNAGSSVVVP